MVNDGNTARRTIESLLGSLSVPCSTTCGATTAAVTSPTESVSPAAIRCTGT
ncbi:MAG: hypothetical protein QOF39_1053, partial [Frankiales bacterium]|nr:hypothetical protein [Frankiales bacterium]